MHTPRDIDHLDSNKQVRNDKISDDEDLHEKETGNYGEIDAEKDKLSGPAIDLVSQPGKKEE